MAGPRSPCGRSSPRRGALATCAAPRPRSSTSSTRWPTRWRTRSGLPRTEGVLAELLPSVGGLHDLADDGPRALRDRRLGRIAPLRAGRRSILQSAPLGVVGVRGGRASPWAEPVLETGAALLAGNAVVLSTPLKARIRAAFERGGVPPELIALAEPRRT